MRPGRWGRALAPALGGLLVTLACAAGPAPPDHFYRLEAGDPHRTFDPPPFPGTIEVRRFRSDAVVAERRMLVRRDGASPEIELEAYHWWTDSPPSAVQVELARFLRAARAADRVVLPEARVRPEYVVSGRILRLERIAGTVPPRVEVEVELSLVRESDRVLLVSETYLEEAEAGSSGVGEAAAAFGRALTRIFDRFLRAASEF